MVAGVRLLIGGATHPGKAHHSMDRRAKTACNASLQDIGKQSSLIREKAGGQAARDKIFVHLPCIVAIV